MSKFEIKRVPGTKRTPYHYDLYVDGEKVYTRKTTRLYNAGAVRFATLGSGDKLTQKWIIESMRHDPSKFEKWALTSAAVTIVHVTHLDIYYQPELKDDEWGVKLYSFEVYRSLENAQEDFPDRKIIKYQGDDIEEPTFVD